MPPGQIWSVRGSVFPRLSFCHWLGGRWYTGVLREGKAVSWRTEAGSPGRGVRKWEAGQRGSVRTVIGTFWLEMSDCEVDGQRRWILKKEKNHEQSINWRIEVLGSIWDEFLRIPQNTLRIEMWQKSLSFVVCEFKVTCVQWVGWFWSSRYTEHEERTVSQKNSCPEIRD